MRNIKAKRIVVKIGTNAITGKKGMIDLKLMQSLAEQIAEIKNKGKDVLIITSGAIGAGMKELNLNARPKEVTMQQVCAAIGQGILMSKYHDLFAKHNIKIAQILLAYEDFSSKKIFRNLQNSLNKLIGLGVVPIINENDPISIDEIGPSFGDNDMLSALIASRMKADLLVILTDVNGLYDKDPKKGTASLIKEVENIDKNIEAIGGKANHRGLGGMKTKIEAAKIATEAGANVVIANGKSDRILSKIMQNKNVGTVFYARK